MFLRSVARKRIGSSPFCARRVWSISSASLRNPPTTITTRRFRRSSTRCGLQNRRKINEETQRVQRGTEKQVKILKQEEGVPNRPVRPLRFAFDCCSASKLLPLVQLKLQDKHQTAGALFLHA